MALYEGMMAEMVTLVGHNNDEISAYYARPMGAGPFPGVVLIHHMPGWDELYREFTRKFAHHGYAAISHNLYERDGQGSAEDVAAIARSNGGVADTQVLDDTDSAIKFLRSQPNSNGKVGVIGTCSGGRHTYLVACKSSQKVDAAADLWGGRVVMEENELSDKMPVAPIDYTNDLMCPLLGLFGEDDSSPPPSQVKIHEDELKRLGKDYEFHMYPGAGHGFFYYDRPMYKIEQAVDGWKRVFSFFNKNLGKT